MTGLDFGVQIEPQYGFTYSSVKEIAKATEKLGYESIWVSDHFFLTPNAVDTNALECYTALTALAVDTKNLRIGAMVASQSYRNPALLANIAASLDHISEGRLYFGIGAGWKEVEYDAYNIPFPRAGARIRQLDETITICRRMWTMDKATFEGKYYRVTDALCMPKPVQNPLPVWVGGTGSQTLRVAAKHADAVNFAWTQTPDFFKERLDVLESHCRKIGRDLEEIRRSAGLMIIMAETREEIDVKLDEQNRSRDSEYMKYLSRQQPNLVGTPDTVAERIAEYVSLGVDHFILRWPYGDGMKSIKLFKDKVMNKV
ncbi:MAG: TIGR03560 family F420-dependent LLM class oxidoreductase [Candidatus Bathyarchaeota archaeon]|nr:TIGR03560 family F420-dependent LLM class oxidoreductase [Candidatus Bathyarchaeota archaeon]